MNSSQITRETQTPIAQKAYYEPEPAYKVVTFKLPPKTIKLLDFYAFKCRTTRSEIIRRAIGMFIENIEATNSCGGCYIKTNRLTVRCL